MYHVFILQPDGSWSLLESSESAAYVETLSRRMDVLGVVCEWLGW